MAPRCSHRAAPSEKELTMLSMIRPSMFLRRALLADAVVSVACGLLMLSGQGLLSGWLGLPAALLHYAGLVLLPYAAIVAFMGTRDVLPRAAVWAVVFCNVVWAIDCIATLMSGWV